MSNYSNSTMAKNVYNSFAKVNGSSGSFAALKKLAMEKYSDVKQNKKEFESHKNELSNTYSKAKASQLIGEYQAAYDRLVRDAKNELSTMLDEVIASKRNTLEDFISKAPSPELLSLLQVMNMRTNINPNELESLLKKSADNFQALSLVHDICEKNGFTFTMPIDIEEENENLSKLENILTQIIKDIDSEDMGYNSSVFYEYDISVPSILHELMQNFDSSVAFAPEVKTPELTVLEKLRAKAEELKENGNSFGAFRTEMLIKENLDVLAPEEIEQIAAIYDAEFSEEIEG